MKKGKRLFVIQYTYSCDSWRNQKYQSDPERKKLEAELFGQPQHEKNQGKPKDKKDKRAFETPIDNNKLCDMLVVTKIILEVSGLLAPKKKSIKKMTMIL